MAAHWTHTWSIGMYVCVYIIICMFVCGYACMYIYTHMQRYLALCGLICNPRKFGLIWSRFGQFILKISPRV